MAMTPARLHEYEAGAPQEQARRSDARIYIPYERIADFCRRYNLAWLALFGSVIRERLHARERCGRTRGLSP